MSGESLILPNDLSDLCRVCLQLPEESQYLDLTTIYDEEDNLTYGECFTICTQIDLCAGDDVPHCLCKTCVLELQMSYDFHKKIEESKRVLEQCRRQLQEQKTNTVGSIDQTTRINSDNVKNMVRLINDKYVISYDEGEEPETSQEIYKDLSVMQHENEEEFEAPIELDHEADQIDVNQMCQTEAVAQHEPHPNNVNTSSIKYLKANEAVEQLEMEDYQNLETLEDEETETLRIKNNRITIPIQITKYKTIECEVNADDVEYEAARESEEEFEEGQQQGLEDEFLQELNIDVEGNLRWQDNVVAVANKEHLPIENDKGEEEEEVEELEVEVEEILYETLENQAIQYGSSQDENVEEDEDEEEQEQEQEGDINKPNARTVENKSKNINNSAPRKRHVGSYSCDFCKRVYPNYSRMKTHRRCHESDRPKFPCSHCDRIYATKQARDCHVQTAHEKCGYSCNICHKVFAIRKSLEIHVRYHTGDFPYACSLCDKKFAQVCHLNTHINVKHNKIRFSCDYPGCGKFFTSSSSLRNHQCTHGIMPFECEYCQQGYPAKAKLRVHIQRKHYVNLNNDQLEKMRKFHVARSKVSLVQFVET